MHCSRVNCMYKSNHHAVYRKFIWDVVQLSLIKLRLKRVSPSEPYISCIEMNTSAMGIFPAWRKTNPTFQYLNSGHKTWLFWWTSIAPCRIESKLLVCNLRSSTSWPNLHAPDILVKINTLIFQIYPVVSFVQVLFLLSLEYSSHQSLYTEIQKHWFESLFFFASIELFVLPCHHILLYLYMHF